MRYRAHLSREIAKTLNELERLQRMRMRQPVPLPTKLEMSSRNRARNFQTERKIWSLLPEGMIVSIEGRVETGSEEQDLSQDKSSGGNPGVVAFLAAPEGQPESQECT